MSLFKRDPGLFKGVEPFAFDRFLDPLWPTGLIESRLDDGPIAPRVDIIEKDKAYVVEADLPGMTKDNVDVSMDGSVLTINAEIEKEDKKESGKVIRHERYNQQYMRRLDLGSNASVKGITADFKNGVLTITIPKINEKSEEPLKIKVN